MQYASQRTGDLAPQVSVAAAGNKSMPSSAPDLFRSNGLSSSAHGKSIHAFVPSLSTPVHGVAMERKDDEIEVRPGGVGLLPEEVYDRHLHPWAAALRRRILKNLPWESEMLAAMQKKVRSPFLDAYFVNASSLGTHTFFMTLLPAFCFFGYQDITRGLIFVLAFGLWFSSWTKDLICSPRPFAPPVTRLTIGTHHLEYGFPSTHSTNCTSIALFFLTILHRLSNTPATFVSSPGVGAIAQNSTQIVQDVAPPMLVSEKQYWIGVAVLVLYMFTIIYGRLYTAMHSFTDCTAGVLLGAAVWVLWLFYGDTLDYWVKNSGYIVPATVIPICLLSVHWHPEPVDDCPCFEDAIAFMAVVMGESLTRWYMSQHGYDHSFFKHVMAGRPFGTVPEMWTWWSIATAKIVVGIGAIFAWRIFAKLLLHRSLPPVYRFLSQLTTLPNRRFYTPATDYKGGPPETNLRSFPSVLDLPGMVEIEVDAVSTAPSRRIDIAAGKQDIKLRTVRGSGSNSRSEQSAGAGKETLGLGVSLEELGGRSGDVDVVKHYDADVLTKVFVYCGIGFIATGGMPIFFELIGWGIRIR